MKKILAPIAVAIFLLPANRFAAVVIRLEDQRPRSIITYQKQVILAG